MLSRLPVWLVCALSAVVPVDPPDAEEPMFGIVDPAAFTPARPLAYEQVFLAPTKFGPRDAATYVVRLYGPEMERFVEVLRNGERVLAMTGMRLRLFEELDQAGPQPPVYSLRENDPSESGEDDAEPAAISVGGTGVTPRTDVTGDGVPELVIANLDGERFAPAPHLMRLPPWSDEVIAARARAIRADKDWVPEHPHGPAALWHQMLSLCMEGSAEQAWKLLELAWPGDAASRDAYRADFERELGEDAFGAPMLRLAKSAVPARILPPDARRVFPNPSPQPGQAAERVIEIRGSRSGCARPVIRVLEQGKRIAEESGRTTKMMLSSLGASSGAKGTDLDGDGHDELVVAEWDDCWLIAPPACLSLYRVWPKFEGIDCVPWDRHGPDVFVNLDDDPQVELRVPEELHGLWALYGQPEPTPPTVILKLKDGRYMPAVTLMAAPAPSEEEIRASALSFRAQMDADPEAQPVPLWTEMLRLAYSGNMRSALDLFDQAWPPERDDKVQALSGFDERLREGRYAPGVFGFGSPGKSDAGGGEP